MVWFLDKEFLEGLDLDAYDASRIGEVTGVSEEMAADFVDRKRMYWVKSNHHYGWLAGADGAGRPTLLYVGSPRLSAAAPHLINVVIFDHGSGALETRGLDAPEEVDWDRILDVAEREVGFVHVGDAPVFAYKHPEFWYCAVVPFPFHLHADALGESAEDPEGARAWIEAGNYVFHFGNAYYMSADGDVESS